MTTHEIFQPFALLREKAGMSIEDVMELTGKSKSSVYRWEKGQIPAEKLAIKVMNERIARANRTQGDRKGAAFRFVDLFAGIGGMRKAFEGAGGRCVFTSEWNKYARMTYQANFDCDHDVAGDITKIEASEIPEHDVLVAGFPCQPFSIAGVSKKNSLGRAHGFQDKTQGTLFFDVARIIEHHRPAAFLLENVKNLKGHDKGRTFQTIMETLKDELGYKVHFRIVDAQHWVPQHRERIFIVGFRDDVPFNFDQLVLPESPPVLGDILHPENGDEEAESPFTTGDLAAVAEKYTLTPRLWDYLQAYADKHKAAGNGFGFGINGRDDVTRTLSARYYKDGSEILLHQHGKRPRRLTPRECARLMGFDMPGEPLFEIPVSDTQSYKQFGNAVVVPKVRAIAQLMRPHILAILQSARQHDPKLAIADLFESEKVTV
ncbi:cytosine methyltransferase [Pseudomonas lactis]|uniref:DNA (cytosine-5-)-methyltransferase n=1 Tax=Pseudomonas lactis TaxID=1615674 RepID=UPI00071303EC|nr:DNA (cytosine-5-)-methyltransferase [Pseudomonas lactis]KRP95839.1 cytosine methyltransferase [Pseudomonas lactis]